MAGVAEQLPLHDDELASGAEFVLRDTRRPARAWQMLAVTAALAVASTAVAMTFRKSRSSARVPLDDAPGQRMFLSEVLLQDSEKKDSGKDTPQEEASKEVAASAEDEAKTTAEPSAKALKAADELVGKAWYFKLHSDNLTNSSGVLKGKVESMHKQVAETKDAASRDRNDAEKLRSDAKDSRTKADAVLKEAAQKAKDLQKEAELKATELLNKAQQKVDDLTAESKSQATDLHHKAVDLESKASGLDNHAIKKDDAADKEDRKAGSLAKKADSLERQATEERETAVADEKQARHDTAAQRMCIALPGVKLRGYSPAGFDPVVGSQKKYDDDWQCSDWCLKHAECKQSVFTWETKTCELFKDRTAEPQYFREQWPWFNSSYCDTADKKQDMLDMLHKVYDAKPWVPPPHNCSWGGDNCIETKCCADVCDASWDFKECKAYTCYKRDENWAGCKTGGPPEGWEGTELGGHPNTEVAPAEEGKLIQGTRLYCFSVVMWNQPPAAGWQASEAELANNWKEQKKGIMQCDDYSIFDGLEGGSVHNIQSFINAWNMVKDDGRWKQNDWSIKVDPDAVFFPEHFRRKLEWVYKTPQGATVYMRNTFYKFKLLGAIEALTREALELYFARGWECEAHLGQEGGEDYWLLQCLEGLGVDYQTDESLLHDKYAADENCDDGYSVAHHFFKKIDDWDACWDTANDAWNNEHPE